MAHISQDEKKQLAPAIKRLLAKYGLNGSLSINHYSTLVLKIKSGRIDFFESYNRLGEQRPRMYDREWTTVSGSMSVNEHYYQDHFDGAALEFLTDLIPAMRGPGWFDHSDSQTDYFFVKHYIDIQIGQWNKPYIVNPLFYNHNIRVV